MKCCHFKMSGRGKRVPLLALFKIRESCFMRNKRGLILKQAEEMKPDLFCFFYKSKPPPPLWFPLCFPPSLFFPAHFHLQSVSDQILMEGLINSFVQRQPTSVLMVRRLSHFFFLRHMPPATCQENKHAIAVKKILKEEKNVCMKKTGMWEEGHSRRQSWRNYVSQASLGWGGGVKAI